MNQNKEIWKCIPEFNVSWFQVSNLGRCRVLDHFEDVVNSKKSYSRFRKGHLIKPSCDSRGRYQVSFHSKLYLLHRLIAEVFCDNPKHTKYVTWKDGDRSNNSADNLVWIDKNDYVAIARKGNVKHCKKVGIYKSLYDGPYKIFDCMVDCAKFIGLTKQAISHWLKHNVEKNIHRSGFYIMEVEDDKNPKLLYT